MELQFTRVTLQNLDAEEGDEKMTCNFRVEDFEATPLGANLKYSNNANVGHFCDSRSDVVDGIEWTVPDPIPPNLNLSDPDLTASNVDSFPAALSFLFGNVTGETHEVELLTPAEGVNEPGSGDQYEIGVPLEKAAECIDGLLNLAEDLSAGTFLRLPLLIRFVGKESALLSASHDRAYVWFQVTDYVYYNREWVISSDTDSI